MPHPITSLAINFEEDVVTARQRARQVATELTFDEQDRTRISTAVSELARAFQHGRRVTQVEFLLEGDLAPQVLIVHIREASRTPKTALRPNGPSDLFHQDWNQALLSARRLMDQCSVQERDGKPVAIQLSKLLPKRAPLFVGSALERLVTRLGTQRPQNPMEEVRQQNQELLRALEELHERQVELVNLNRELEDTNRGVVALYAELDEKAGHLRRADEMKSRFLSNMSHEFRTPLNAILALSQLLLDRADGQLTAEQEKQVGYIRKSGEDLLVLVNDLLDLAKIEAGKIVVRRVEFDVENLFSALRGMLRPLLVSNQVTLVFEKDEDVARIRSDEGKVSQILRNFISNAIKFTERGEVRVRASLTDDRRAVAFSVSDTGIGIAEADQERIFEEFSQIDHPIQRKVKGTGLGLPLCRKLAGLLGGSVAVVSRLGAGSTFTATIPLSYEGAEPAADAAIESPAFEPRNGAIPVLIVEDEPETRLIYESYLKKTPFQPIPAGRILQAREQLRRQAVSAIILDVLLPDDSAWQWLAELKGQEATKHIPVLMISSVEDPQKGLALGADDYAVKPVRREWLLDRLERVTGLKAKSETPLVLIIDDQEADRYILRRYLSEAGYAVAEASGGQEGLQRAHELKPAVTFLDLTMPEMDGFQVLAQLRSDAGTSSMPVVVVSSLTPLPTGDPRLAHARALLSKKELSSKRLQQVMNEAIGSQQLA